MKNINVKLLMLANLFLATTAQAQIPEAIGSKYECVKFKSEDETVIATIELDPESNSALLTPHSFGGWGSYEFSNVGKCPTRLCGTADLVIGILPNTKAPSETLIKLQVRSGGAVGTILFSQHGTTHATEVYCNTIN